MPDGRHPLRGRNVLLPRPVGLGGGWAERLESLGAVVDRRPAIAFEPPRNPVPAREAVSSLERYQRIVVTSPTGARFFLERLHDAGRSTQALRVRFAAVGPGTARSLREAGLEVDLVAEDSRAEGLAEVLGPRIRPGDRVLLVRPERTREVLGDALATAGARVDEVAFYRTVPSSECPDLAAAVARGAFDAVVFTSPSTLLSLQAAGDAGFGDGLRRARRIAIGAVTAETLSAAGFPATEVAAQPTAEAIAEAVVRSFEA